MDHQIKALLFDLDGTLLPMDQEVFTKAYFAALAAKAAQHGYDAEELIRVVWGGTKEMVTNSGQCTNEEAFWCYFCEHYGKEAYRDKEIFDSFYRNEFDKARSVCGFAPKAAQCIAQAKNKGFRIILATNPLFPSDATYARIRWAGLSPEDFELITTYENSCHCKPNPAYYQDILNAQNLLPEQCIMIGNDADEDLIAGTLGMQVFLLTDCLINRSGRSIETIPQGGFNDLLVFLGLDK